MNSTSLYQNGKIFFSSDCLLKLIAIFIAITFLNHCVSNKPKSNLDPDSQAFLSTVRYIITKEERKTFLNLFPQKRADFIEEFWKKRDPDPTTEENEFKEQYFTRIEEANNLFRDSPEDGWLQDRGRVYILLGPPERRDVFPRGQSFYGKPMEIWYYGIYPIVFIDEAYSNNYKLQPISARNIAEINSAQMDLKPKIKSEKLKLDFNLKAIEITTGKILIEVSIPYKNIWFLEKDNKLETIMELSLEIFDSRGKRIMKEEKDYSLSLSSKDLVESCDDNYIIKIPVMLKKGDYSLTILLINKTDETQVRKMANFSI